MDPIKTSVSYIEAGSRKHHSSHSNLLEAIKVAKKLLGQGLSQVTLEPEKRIL